MRSIFAVTLFGWLMISVTYSLAAATYRSSFYVYEGEGVSARLEQLSVVTEDGQARPLAEVFDGYTPFSGFFTPFMPMRRIYIIDRDIHDPGFIDLLTRYDANDNGLVEIPELTVLYIVEGARGLDYPAAALRLQDPVRAVHTTADDLHGLRLFIKENRGRMAAPIQAHFRRLEDMYLTLFLRNGDIGSYDWRYDR